MSASTGDVCPNGHVSGDPDWCDTCGAPMHGAGGAGGAGGASPPASGGSSVGTSGASAIAPVSCPHCGAINAADNLFCESCGYDFVTGQAPEPPPAPAVPAPAAAASVAPADPAAIDPIADPAGATATGPAPVSPSWVVIVEVDPAWYALKGELADRPLPSPSTSTVPLQQHASMIGRTSQSRGVRPEVALDTDTAVSRRHAQLVLEGDVLSVVDLSSTNGTYVLGRGQVPADDGVPLASGVPTVLDDGDQIFVGAWSRLTLRRT